MPEIDLSIVIASWNTRDLLRSCLESLRADARAAPRAACSREIIVVDNASEDGSAEMVEEDFPEVHLLRNPQNRLYSVAYNQGAQQARGRYLCLLNSDTEVRRGALDLLLEFLDENPEYGAVSPKLLNVDGTVQRACSRFPGLAHALLDSTSLGRVPPWSWLRAYRDMHDFDHEHSRDVEQPPAAVMMVHRREYLRMGGLDPQLSLYFNDVDFCRRLWARGRRIRYLAEAEVVHHMGASTSELSHVRRSTLWFQNRESYFAKHHGAVGRAWVRGVLYAHAAEVAARITLGPQSREAARASRRELLAMVRSSSRHAPLPSWALPAGPVPDRVPHAYTMRAKARTA
jgi:GT2 family glycosyltransferase